MVKEGMQVVVVQDNWHLVMNKGSKKNVIGEIIVGHKDEGRASRIVMAKGERVSNSTLGRTPGREPNKQTDRMGHSFSNLKFKKYGYQSIGKLKVSRVLTPLIQYQFHGIIVMSNKNSYLNLNKKELIKGYLVFLTYEGSG
ncbi:hypothetical protein AMTR_s00156p00043330 [Amborella trichopoda]|uniref:Uncharacterized protein n=1 Tax=Amborella trichopoda TaxID=13333 RepID=W1PJW5_AMBTC|nr:hypothetical protein AMTR_s00156p00043330 [Amborella trichopoda]